jgi:hypothetical protein
MKANKIKREWEVLNYRRRKDKQSESSIDSDAHNQILKKLAGITKYLSILT